jgi:hypothetical protein
MSASKLARFVDCSAGEAAPGATKDELLELANPLGRDAHTLVSDTLDELADVFELTRAIVSGCPQELSEDSVVRRALDSTLSRAHERANTASRLACRVALEGRRALDPKVDEFPARVSAAIILNGVVPPSLLRAFKELRPKGAERLSSCEWLKLGQQMVIDHRNLQKLAGANHAC